MGAPHPFGRGGPERLGGGDVVPARQGALARGPDARRREALHGARRPGRGAAVERREQAARHRRVVHRPQRLLQRRQPLEETTRGLAAPERGEEFRRVAQPLRFQPQLVQRLEGVVADPVAVFVQLAPALVEERGRELGERRIEHPRRLLRRVRVAVRRGPPGPAEQQRDAVEHQPPEPGPFQLPPQRAVGGVALRRRGALQRQETAILAQGRPGLGRQPEKEHVPIPRRAEPPRERLEVLVQRLQRRAAHRRTERLQHGPQAAERDAELMHPLRPRVEPAFRRLVQHHVEEVAERAKQPNFHRGRAPRGRARRGASDAPRRRFPPAPARALPPPGPRAAAAAAGRARAARKGRARRPARRRAGAAPPAAPRPPRAGFPPAAPPPRARPRSKAPARSAERKRPRPAPAPRGPPPPRRRRPRPASPGCPAPKAHCRPARPATAGRHRAGAAPARGPPRRACPRRRRARSPRPRRPARGALLVPRRSAGWRSTRGASDAGSMANSSTSSGGSGGGCAGAPASTLSGSFSVAAPPLRPAGRAAAESAPAARRLPPPRARARRS